VFCFFRRAKSPLTGTYYIPVKRSYVYPLAVLISVRGLLLWCVALAIAGYFFGAAGLAYWFHQKPFNRVTYADLVLPWRWEQLEARRGQSNLAQAEAEFEAGNYRSAFAYLRTGLARYPDDAQARLKLANLFIAFRLRAEAEKTLINAFDHTYPGGDYIKSAVAILEASDNAEFLLSFCDRGRAALATQADPSARDARFLDGIKARVLFQLDRPDEAVALVEKYHPKDLEFLQMARVTQKISRKDPAASEAELKTWLAARPDSEQALSMAVRVYRAAGQGPELQEAILRLRSRYPDNPAHISLALSACLRLGQVQEALDLLDLSVIRFANKSTAYLKWAEAISETGNDAALARLEQLATETNQNPQPIILTRLMAQIRRQAWADAEASSARLDALYPNVTPTIKALHAVAKALIESCSKSLKGAENTLVSSIAGGWVSLRFYGEIVEALTRAERYETAMEVLTLAEGYYPTSRFIAVQRAEIAVKLAEQNARQPSAIAKQLSGTGAGPAVPANAKDLFAALDAYVEAERNANAFALIRAVRKADPAWLQAALPELEWREVLMAANVDDIALLELNLRALLRTASPTQIERSLAQAEVWFSARRTSYGLMAVREVLKVRPEDPRANRLLAEWRPRPSASDTMPFAAAPAPGGAEPAPALPASAESFFTAIDALSTGARAADALRLVRLVRKAEPEWLGTVLPELEWREVLLAVRADDPSLLQLNLRTYLRGKPGGVTRVLDQAKVWRAEGRNAVALLTVREVLRQQPDDAAAQKLLREWSAP
jgi:hypothetical protein